ncbi:DeoR family transcriptional regulator [Candidatus Dojkabacteria bacterium]|nr:DeoR family transcriptional regulator [Candidatus Dojkabacteria bacterium]
MFEPKHQISNNILNSIVKLEVQKKSIEFAGTGTKLRNKLQKRAKALNLFHFAHIIGINITLKDAERLADGKKLVTDDARGTILNNFRNTLEFSRSNIAETYVDIDLNILTHLNKILLTDWKESWDAKFRTAGEELDLSLENWATYRDKSIQSERIQNEVIDLIDWYKSNISRIHPLIRIAIFVSRFIEISPFVYANKLTAIAIADFLLYKSNYVEKTFLPTSRHFDVYEDEYLESWNKDSEDQTLWIERFTRNLANDMLETRNEIKRELKEEESTSRKPFLDLNKRQLKILRYLQTIPTVKREDYVQMMDVSTMTAFRDLNGLVKKRLLKVQGKGRGTKYMLTNR